MDMWFYVHAHWPVLSSVWSEKALFVAGKGCYRDSQLVKMLRVKDKWVLNPKQGINTTTSRAKETSQNREQKDWESHKRKKTITKCQLLDMTCLLQSITHRNWLPTQDLHKIKFTVKNSTTSHVSPLFSNAALLELSQRVGKDMACQQNPLAGYLRKWTKGSQEGHLNSSEAEVGSIQDTFSRKQKDLEF